MTASDCEIALATVDDIPGIVELQRLNLLSNGGFLSIEFSDDWFERVLSEMPIIVARRDGRIVGYLVSSPVSVAAREPIIQAKLRAYPSSRNPYNHGPVCIAKEERNQGLISRMFEALRERLGGEKASHSSGATMGHLLRHMRNSECAELPNSRTMASRMPWLPMSRESIFDHSG